ncbi:hypothetical protein QCA50_005880 [Cerrena zonata]|uniref:Vacuolar protein sorting-associated protein 51 homolog n=1 Tax=Cerrena zonata TaxID=2478898 RepID=A0AAW0GBP9_9APHY
MSQSYPNSIPGTPPRHPTPSTLRQASSPLAFSSTSHLPPLPTTPTTAGNQIRSFSDAALAVTARQAKRSSIHGSGVVTGSGVPGTPPPGGLGLAGMSAGVGGAGGGGKTSKTSKRDLLRKHYGLGVGPPPAMQGKIADPMDLDSTAFDAKAYYEQLITTSSLPVLLRRENDLLTEIRQLDSERQSLVYNHHHELIAASDTIAAMKDRAERLDADMDLLKAAFSEISRLSSELAAEAPSRERHDSER